MASRVTIESITPSSSANTLKVKYVIPKSRKLWPEAINSEPVVAMIFWNVDQPADSQHYYGYTSVLSSTKYGKVNTAVISGTPAGHQIYFMLYVMLRSTPSMHTAEFYDVDNMFYANTRSRYMVKIKEPNDENAWTDVTQFIEVPTYEVNNNPQTEEWEDGGWNKHVVCPNYRIEGSFKVLLYDRSVYNQFIDLVQRNRAAYGGLVWMKVQVNNELDPNTDYDGVEYMLPELYKAFFKMEVSPVWNIPFMGVKPVDSIEVQIEEVEHNALPELS